MKAKPWNLEFLFYKLLPKGPPESHKNSHRKKGSRCSHQESKLIYVSAETKKGEENVETKHEGS